MDTNDLPELTIIGSWCAVDPKVEYGSQFRLEHVVVIDPVLNKPIGRIYFNSNEDMDNWGIRLRCEAGLRMRDEKDMTCLIDNLEDGDPDGQ